MLLRDRRDDLDAAGIRPVAISMDSPWSHRSWAEALGVHDAVQLLSDWEGEASRAFGVEIVVDEMRVSARSAFLLADGTVRAAWMLGSEMPDIEAAIAAASPSSP
jgi:glutaredoxin-dependent peroxiredoxin